MSHNRIFIESAPELGLLYNRYKSIPDKLEDFVDDLEDQMNIINKEGVENASETNTELTEKIQKFKKDIEIDMKKPEAIELDSMKSTRKQIEECRRDVENQLNRIGKLRHSAKWGNNWIDGILFRSKILHHSQDVNIQKITNEVARTITRGLDWAEKITLDLLNLTSQDLNILTLTDKVYYRNIFEHGELDIDLKDIYDIIEETDDIMNLDISEEYEWISPFAENDENEEPEENPDYPKITSDDIMTMRLGKKNEPYYPIWCITMSTPEAKEGDSDKEKAIKGCAGMIRGATLGETHSHATISFDPTLQHTYTFDITNRFHEENLQTNDETTIYVSDNIYVAVTFLTADEVNDVKQAIVDYNNNQSSTRYDVKQLVGQIFGSVDHVDRSQICSTFVGYLLNVANPKNIHRDYGMIRPEDITLFPRSFHVITFNSQQDLRDNIGEVAKRTKLIYEQNIDEIREYNNELPKILIKEKIHEKRFIDKIFDALGKFLH